VNSKLFFFVTKRLQLRFKKNAAAAAEPNGLLVSAFYFPCTKKKNYSKGFLK
jgi:hypothetical protein